MSISEDELLLVRLQPLLGRETGPFHSWDAVNLPMIRHWCEAMAIENPLYFDTADLGTTLQETLLAPPSMLLVWGMNGLRGKAAPGSTGDTPYAALHEIHAAGYPGIIVVNSEQEYLRYLRPGDQLYRTTQIESVSGRKQTSLGTGYFVSEHMRFFDQHDNLVGHARVRMFLYRTAESRTRSEPLSARLPEKNRTRAPEVAMNDLLPSLSIPITVTDIVAGAIATRDYQNIHHDVDAARALGTPNIFMNFLTTHGWVERFVAHWKPTARLRSVALKLGVPNYPGDTLTFNGHITEKFESGELNLSIHGHNALGSHVTAMVRVLAD